MKNENVDPVLLSKEQLEVTVGGRLEVGLEIRGLFARKLGLPIESIALSSRIIDDLGADSLDVVDILKTTEKRFGVTVLQSSLSRVKTVSDFVDLFGKQRP